MRWMCIQNIHYFIMASQQISYRLDICWFSATSKCLILSVEWSWILIAMFQKYVPTSQGRENNFTENCNSLNSSSRIFINVCRRYSVLDKVPQPNQQKKISMKFGCQTATCVTSVTFASKIGDHGVVPKHLCVIKQMLSSEFKFCKWVGRSILKLIN